MQSPNDRSRCARRGEYSDGRRRFVAGYTRAREGRQIGEARRWLHGRYRKRFQFCGSDQRSRCCPGRESELDLPGNEIDHAGGAAAIREYLRAIQSGGGKGVVLNVNDAQAGNSLVEQIQKEFKVPKEFAHYTGPTRLRAFLNLFYHQLVERGFWGP